MITKAGILRMEVLSGGAAGGAAPVEDTGVGGRAEWYKWPRAKSMSCVASTSV